ncbi:Lon protease-like protein 2 [Characodon lateralis]|uniref:Lon protease-like protein 2 n=1 Tax=Characodon lateralis TaxID=208331 RepID=A0ABU7D322_9TELE|nr:Lon protease-like protein 2 [Characodon lateralis]
MASAGGIQIPSRLPLLLTHEGVLLPGSTVRFSVDSPRNMQLVSQRLLKGTSLKSTIIGVIPNTRDPEQDSDPLPPLHQIGTAGIAVQVVGSNWPKPHYTLLITGLCRFRVSNLVKERPFVLAEVAEVTALIAVNGLFSSTGNWPV